MGASGIPCKPRASSPRRIGTVTEAPQEQHSDAQKAMPRFADSGTILLLVLCAITLILITTYTGPNAESVLGSAGLTFTSSGMVVVIWLLSAAGFGAWILRWMPEGLARDVTPATRLLLALGLGTPAQLFIASALGVAGLLSKASGWGVLVLGMILLAVAIRTSSRKLRIGPGEGWLPAFTWTAAPAIAVLFIASVSAPGWLWQSEFGGYDALSYHLQLPREWLGAGHIFTPTWNVYGSLPNLMEAGYYHMMVIAGNPLPAAISAQLLHATLALLTAISTGMVAGRWFDTSKIGAGFALLIGTPWVIVVGSLAYDEMLAAFMLSTAMLLFVPDMDASGDTTGERMRAGFAAGLLAGAACGAKLTAVGFVALPILYLLLRGASAKAWRDALPVCAFTMLVILSPWLIRNIGATGNPVFPFLASVFGTGHFSEEQVSRFMTAHTSTDNLPGRFGQLWDQFFRYGIGSNPVESEPWRAQWSILPLLAMCGLVVGLVRETSRRRARDLVILTAIVLVFWLAATHQKSRFLVPAIPILVASATMLLPSGLMRPGNPARLGRIGISILLLAWCLWPVRLFQTERIRQDAPSAAMMVGRLDVATGLFFAREARNQATQEEAMRIIHMGGPNAMLGLLPKEERVLALGNATPFLMPRDIEYATVWDNHPLGELLELHPDDPDAVVDALRKRGTTMLLVNPVMMNVWQQSGWLDPRLDPVSIDAVLERLTLETRWPSGEFLMRVPPAVSAP